MVNKLITFAIILLVVIGGGYFLYQNRSDTEETVMMEEKFSVEDESEGETMMDETTVSEGMMGEEETMMEDEGMMSDVKTFEVAGGSFYFTPDEIRVKKGDAVKIVFTNEGGTHDWVLDEFDSRTEIIQTGETDEVEFVADQAGEFEYYCSVGDHRARGMVGTLVVE